MNSMLAKYITITLIFELGVMVLQIVVESKMSVGFVAVIIYHAVTSFTFR